jgi:hypothetical protein
MKIKKSIIALSLVASALFVGCNDDSSDSSTATATETGTFADAPVQGLSYKTATQSGFTDANGDFKYVAGETVEFKLGNLSLGSSVAGDFMTPYTISDNNDTATNIALLLQNFDGNRSNSNTLDLSKLKDYNFTTSDFNLSADPATVQASIETIFADNNFAQYRDDTNNSVLTESDVKTNMDEYIDNNSIAYTKEFTVDYLNAKTLYSNFIDFNEPTKSQVFNLNTQVSFLDENVNPAVTRTDAYQAMDGMIRIVDGKLYEYTTDDNGNYNDGVNIYTITSIDTDKIICSVQIPEVTTVYFYFNQLKAEANSVSVENGFGADWLDGKTLWLVYINEDNNNEKRLLKTTFSNGYITIYLEDGTTVKDSYSLIDGILSVGTDDYQGIKAIDGDQIDICQDETLSTIQTSCADQPSDPWYFTTEEAATAFLNE